MSSINQLTNSYHFCSWSSRSPKPWRWAISQNASPAEAGCVHSSGDRLLLTYNGAAFIDPDLPGCARCCRPCCSPTTGAEPPPVVGDAATQSVENNVCKLPVDLLTLSWCEPPCCLQSFKYCGMDLSYGWYCKSIYLNVKLCFTAADIYKIVKWNGYYEIVQFLIETTLPKASIFVVEKRVKLDGLGLMHSRPFWVLLFSTKEKRSAKMPCCKHLHCQIKSCGLMFQHL